MQKKELIESVGKYIDKYYIPANDDIRLDKEMKDIFQKIADFCQKRKKEKNAEYSGWNLGRIDKIIHKWYHFISDVPWNCARKVKAHFCGQKDNQKMEES